MPTTTALRFLCLTLALFTLYLPTPTQQFCQLPKKERMRVGSIIWKSILDETKGRHVADKDDCRRDPWRQEWLEIMVENREAAAKAREEQKKLEKLKPPMIPKKLTISLFTPKLQDPVSHFTSAVIAMRYVEPVPLRLPIGPKPRPLYPAYRPIEVHIVARKGDISTEFVRTVNSNWKDPVIKPLLKANFKILDLMGQVFAAIKWPKDKTCAPKIVPNPMYINKDKKKQLKNLMVMKGCNDVGLRDRIMRIESFSNDLDGDEMVFSMKLRRSEFCQPRHRKIPLPVAAKKSLFYKMYGCWYKDYPIQTGDVLMKHVDAFLEARVKEEHHEQVWFDDSYVKWPVHHVQALHELGLPPDVPPVKHVPKQQIQIPSAPPKAKIAIPVKQVVSKPIPIMSLPVLSLNGDKKTSRKRGPSADELRRRRVGKGAEGMRRKVMKRVSDSMSDERSKFDHLLQMDMNKLKGRMRVPENEDSRRKRVETSDKSKYRKFKRRKFRSGGLNKHNQNIENYRNHQNYLKNQNNSQNNMNQRSKKDTGINFGQLRRNWDSRKRYRASKRPGANNLREKYRKGKLRRDVLLHRKQSRQSAKISSQRKYEIMKNRRKQAHAETPAKAQFERNLKEEIPILKIYLPNSEKNRNESDLRDIRADNESKPQNLKKSEPKSEIKEMDFEGPMEEDNSPDPLTQIKQRLLSERLLHDWGETTPSQIPENQISDPESVETKSDQNNYKRDHYDQSNNVSNKPNLDNENLAQDPETGRKLFFPGFGFPGFKPPPGIKLPKPPKLPNPFAQTPAPPAPTTKEEEARPWPRNPAFEFSIAYNSFMTQDIFFRQDKVKMPIKAWTTMLKKVNLQHTKTKYAVASPAVVEMVPKSEFPEYVERNGKVFKVVYTSDEESPLEKTRRETIRRFEVLRNKDLKNELKDETERKEFHELLGKVKNWAKMEKECAEIKTLVDRRKEEDSLSDEDQIKLWKLYTKLNKQLKKVGAVKKGGFLKGLKGKAGKSKPDYVEGLVISVGFHALLNKTLSDSDLLKILNKEFPETKIPSATGLNTGKLFNISVNVNGSDVVKFSFGMLHYKKSARVKGEITPFRYERWIFVREILEPFYIDQLKKYTKIGSKADAENKHKMYLKNKWTHKNEIKEQIKERRRREEEEEERRIKKEIEKRRKVEEQKARRRSRRLGPGRFWV